MPTIGPTDRPEVFEWHTDESNQQVNRLTLPERMRITRLGAWIRGVSGYGDVNYKLCLWDPSSGSLHAQTASYSIGPAGVNVSNLTNVERDLSAPVELDAGVDVYCGIAWSPGGALQTGWHDHGSLPLHRDRSVSNIPANMAASNSSAHSGTGPIAAYIAQYEAIAGAWIYRSGTWIRADSVNVLRSGSWSEADSVGVFRSGSWTDAD